MGWFSKEKVADAKKPLVGKFGLTSQQMMEEMNFRGNCPENENCLLTIEYFYSLYLTQQSESSKLKERLTKLEERLNNI